MMGMLEYDPEKRMLPQEIFATDFMKTYGVWQIINIIDYNFNMI